MGAQIIEAKNLYAIQRFSLTQLRMNIVSRDRVPSAFIRVKVRRSPPTHARVTACGLYGCHGAALAAQPPEARLLFLCAWSGTYTYGHTARRAACQAHTPTAVVYSHNPHRPQLVRGDGSPSLFQRTQVRKNTSTPLYEALFYFNEINVAEVR